MRTRVLRIARVVLCLANCFGGEAAYAQTGDGVPLYDNLGSHHYEVTTTEPLAQRYFDQGLRLYYAFNHGEAIRAFGEAARLDPRCGMCYWGVALAYGPNINLPMDSASGAAAYAAAQQAVAAREHVSARERALIDAVARRYSPVPLPDRTSLDTAWAGAMADVAARYPDDADVAVLYAEALMTLSPWQYWNRDGSPRPHTTELVAVLERVLAAQPDHPGANHFFIHAVEAVDPYRAVPMAERLAGLMPGAGHLVHMPGHIYVRVGRYLDAIEANEHAVHADETWIQDHNPALGIYTLGYYPHNYDFLAFAASMIGRGAQALEAADRMASLVPPEMLGAPGLTVLQNHLSRRLQMRVRFARWHEILAEAGPDEDLPYARAIWHYARGRALAAQGNAAGAAAELTALRTAAGHADLADAFVEFNAAADLLAVAGDVLAAYVARADGDMDGAVRLLRSAAEREDDLTYGEPPEWSIPVRHDLGNVLVAAGRFAEAEAAFLEDLERFPDNGWSLDGLARSIAAQGRTEEAAEVRRRFDAIWSTADTEIEDVLNGGAAAGGAGAAGHRH